MDIKRPVKEKRHELRKELKLLKLSRMKLKKQLRLSMRVRTTNRLRLEGEINDLNLILLNLKNKCLNEQKQATQTFVNPKFYECNNEEILNKLSNEKIDPEYKFYCDRCNFKCRKKGAFDIHLRRHTGDKPFSCDLCEKSFVAKYDLKLHRAKHLRNCDIYHCDSCEYTTYRPDMLVNHMEKHSMIKVFNCDLCEFKSNERTKLSKHKNEDHGIIHVCVGCEQIKKLLIIRKNKMASPEDNVELNKIRRNISHTCGKRWMCYYCATSFKKQETLIKHERIHTGERPYKCDRCDYAAAIKSTLIIHKRTHTGQKPYACDQCSFRCTTRSYLKIHLNQHNGVKPFACDQCNYKSVDSCKLVAHKKVRHNEERPFSCQHCPFKAKLKSRLNQHSRTHGLHPFVCPHCAKSFSVRRMLIEHEGIHNGNQPYSCNICKEEKRFTLKSTYRVHMSRHFLKFACNKCDYKTSLRKDLLRHSMVHENELYRPRRKFEKTLQCSFCKFKCVQGMTLKKHEQSNHPNGVILHEGSTEELNSFPETNENSSQIEIPTTILNETSSLEMHPSMTSHFANPLIVNMATGHHKQTESDLQTSNLVIQNGGFSQDHNSTMYKKVTTFSTVDGNKSADYKHNDMGHSIIDTINSSAQCEYSISDTYKLLIHRKTHLTDENIYMQ